MGKLHWLILFPYYFFGALTLLGVLLLIARLTRLEIAINTLVTTAMVVSLVTLIVPLVFGWVGIGSFTGLGVAMVLVASFVVAAIDAFLYRSLPLPLDEELTAEDH